MSVTALEHEAHNMHKEEVRSCGDSVPIWHAIDILAENRTLHISKTFIITIKTAEFLASNQTAVESSRRSSLMPNEQMVGKFADGDTQLHA